MNPVKWLTIQAVCDFIQRQDPNIKITIRGFGSLRIHGSSATVGDEFRRSYSPIIGNTPLYRTIVETIHSLPKKGNQIIVAFTDGRDNASGGVTAQSVQDLFTDRRNVVFWFMASTPDAQAVGTAMGAHSILPYSDQHIGAALEAVHESQQVYRRTGTPGLYKQRDMDAAMGRV
jgi:hypothetical protein